MSRRRRDRGRRKKVPAATPKAPKSGYRLYLERCEEAGKRPMHFPEFLVAARRWRLEYDAATRRGDRELVEELEDLLCARPAGQLNRQAV